MFNKDGQRVLHQDEAALNAVISNMSQDCPTTEIELLQAILNDGFMPNHANTLMEKLAGNSKGLMTTSRGKMHELVQSLISDPTGTTAQILGSSAPVTVNTAEVDDFSLLNEATILDEGEFTHLAEYVNLNAMKTHESNGGDQVLTGMPNEISNGPAIHGRGSNTFQSILPGSGYDATTATSAGYGQMGLQRGFDTSMVAVHHQNLFDGFIFQDDENSDYRLGFSRQPASPSFGKLRILPLLTFFLMPLVPVQNLPVDFEHDINFSQYF